LDGGSRGRRAAGSQRGRSATVSKAAQIVLYCECGAAAFSIKCLLGVVHCPHCGLAPKRFEFVEDAIIVEEEAKGPYENAEIS
jgi:hypothetical protein